MANRCSCGKSTLTANNTVSQTLAVNSPLTFTSSTQTKGCNGNGCIQLSGTTTINLVKEGLYYVSVNCSGAISGSTAGDVSVQIYNNGVPITGALATAYSDSTSTIVNLGADTVVKVNHSCSCVDNTASLTFVNTGLSASYANAYVTVIRID